MSGLRRAVIAACWGGACAGLVILLAGSGWLPFFFVYPAQAFLLHVAVGSAVIAVLAAVLRAVAPAAIAVAVVAGAGIVVWPLPPEPSESGVAGAELTVLQANLWGNQTDPAHVLRIIRESGADLVALQEVSGRLAPQLESLLDVYPYQARGGNRPWGPAALLSKHPWVGEPVATALGDSPYVRARVVLPKGPAEVVALHLDRPFGAGQMRDIRTLGVSLALLPRDLPVLVIGDINATPWMLAVRTIERIAGLGVVSGLRPSWPAKFWPLGLPIDHVLARGFIATSSRYAASTGSDHRALLVTLKPVGGSAATYSANLDEDIR